MAKVTNWTVILYFEGDTQHHYNLSKTAAKKLIDVAVFNNEDCIHFRCFQQSEEVPKLPEPLKRGIGKVLIMHINEMQQ